MVIDLSCGRPRAQRIAGACLLIAASFFASVGFAQANDGDEMNRLRLDAYQAIGEGRLADAFKTLSQLYEARPNLWDACNAGRIAYRMGRLPQAHHYLSACDERGQKADPKTLDFRDKRILKESRNDLALVRTQVARLMVTVNKPGAEVFVDGSKIGTSPIHDEIGLEPGDHRVKATFGDVSAEREYTIAKGELGIADLVLPDPPPSKAPLAPATSPKKEPAKTAPPLPPAPPVWERRQWPGLLLVTAGVVEVVGVAILAGGYTTAQSEYGRMQKTTATVKTMGCNSGACDKFLDAEFAGDIAGADGVFGFAICNLVASGLFSASIIGILTDRAEHAPAEQARTQDTPVKVEAIPTVGGVVIRATF